jgi:arylsulfatase A-like enzyme
VITGAEPEACAVAPVGEGSAARPAARITRASMGLAVALAAAALLGGCARKVSPPRVEAVFLIVVDTMRPDVMSCYGFTGIQTPNMDRLAASGVRFEHAESVASWTVPSMGAMLTSRYPTQLGLVERPAAPDQRFPWRQRRLQVRYTLPHGIPTLASLLDDAGFYPAAFVNQPFINVLDGFPQGFAAWCYTAAETTVRWQDPSKPIPAIVYPPGTDLGKADSLLVATFGAWLGQNADRRPFVWLHLLKPHWPYTPALRYLPVRPDSSPPLPPAQLYALEVRETDDRIGEILAAIDARVGLKRSLVILVADHGEEFLDHGGYEHGHSLHREVIHVPLVMAGPSLPAGAVVEAYVRTTDLLPTVLTLVGAGSAIPRGAVGENLLPLLAGGGKDRPVYSEGMFYGGTKRSLIEDGYKLIVDVQERQPFQLFNVVTDPFERTDLAQAQPERVASMRDSLARRHAGLVGDFAALLGPDSVRTSPETEKLLRAMRTLGYVGK